MKVARIKIENILGIAELEIEPGTLTEITGSNGSGKTSILEAIKAIVAPGHDATLLRNGETHGEAVIVLDNGMTIGKRITGLDSERFVLDGKESIKKPATVIAGLADLVGVNPVAFLSAPPKDRTRILLETIPLEADLDRLADIMAAAQVDKPIGTGGRHALVVIDAARQAVFDTRTGVNRAITEKKGTIAQLEATLPPPSEADVGDATALLTKADELDAARDAEVARVNTKVAGIVTEAQGRIQKIRDAAEVVLDGLRKQIESATAQRDAEIAKENAGIATIQQKAETQNGNTRATHAAQRAEITAQVQAIQAAQKQAARYAVTRDNIASMQGALGDLEAESEAQTAAIEEIDAYKLEMLATLPIPGLAVVDGEIVRDGIPFDRLNEAQRVTIAIELAKLRAGELKIACVDGLECMDQMTYDEFKRQAKASGVQFFVTKVSNGELTVSSSPYTEEVL